MKVATLVLTFGSFAFSAPRSPKVFYEHFEDFLQLIVKEAGQDLELLLQQYVQYDEFSETINYLQTHDFMDVVCEIESLPEFKAMVSYLEKDNIDIIYFIDLLNQLLETVNLKTSVVLHQSSGKNMTAYMKDSIRLFPKAKLAALFADKMANHKEFEFTIDKLRSQEWRHILHDLWTNKTFRTLCHNISMHGLNVAVLVQELEAIFGQN